MQLDEGQKEGAVGHLHLFVRNVYVLLALQTFVGTVKKLHRITYTVTNQSSLEIAQ